MSSSPALRITLLGTQTQVFAQTVQARLTALPTAPSRTIVWTHGLEAAAQADLRWLLAWEDGQTLEALASHQTLRQSLHGLGLSYQVLRGTPSERLAQALSSLRPWLPELAPVLPATGEASRRSGWSCSECSDPDCEHRSFTALLARREGG